MQLTSRRLLAAIAATGVAAIVLSGCSGATAGSSSSAKVPEAIDLKGETVVALFTSFNNDYFADFDKGARSAVESLNGRYVAMTNEGDPATQLAQFEQQIDEGARIFVAITPDQSTVSEMARIAEENNVCFANTWDMEPWSSPFDFGNAYAAYQTLNVEEAAYETATALFEEMGGSGNFVHLTGRPGQKTDSQRTEGVDRALSEHPGIVLLDRQPAPEWSRDSGRNTMAGVISRHGSDIDGVFGQNDDVGIGALNALSEADITDVPITGLDGNAGTIDLVQSGEMFATYTSFPSWSGGFSAVQAIDLCMSGETSHPLARQLWTGGELVSSANVDEFVDTYMGDELPYDWAKMSRAAYPEDWDPQNSIRALDMERQWKGDPEPAGYELPAPYAEAWPNVDEFNADMDARWKHLRRD